MEKKELAGILNKILISVGFKKKCDFWVMNGDVITKMVNLQKSKFGNNFYINYGFILNSIPLKNLMMHVFKGLSSVDTGENRRIKELLDLENTILETDRETELNYLINNKIVAYLQVISTEEDLLYELKKLPHLNEIPLIVKKHFNLE